MASTEDNRLEKALDEYQVSLARAGDKRAFTLLYKRWHPRLLRFAYRLTRDNDAARDVMQDAAMAMAKTINKLDDPARFSGWAYTIVRRRSADYIRRQIRHRDIQSRYKSQPAEAQATHDIDAALSLKQALSQLPPQDRVLLKLFYLDGMTGTEMSDVMGVPVGTVKSRLFKARETLKSIYETHNTGEPHV